MQHSSKPETSTVIPVDCHYLEPSHAAAFLIVEDGQAAFVDNGVNSSIPHLTDALVARGLRPEDVVYAIVTHVHLDHAGGTASLLDTCPNATALAHPKAARHLGSPGRLVRGVRKVYGDAFFDRIYGDIRPCPTDRLRAMGDGERISLGNRTLQFFYTPGHASHHLSIHDSGTNGVFTGDALGICHPSLQHGHRPYVFAAAAPTEFDPELSRDSVQRILSKCPDYVYMTHFGSYDNVQQRAESMLEAVDRCAEIIKQGLTFVQNERPDDNGLQAFIHGKVREAIADQLQACGVTVTPETQHWIDNDVAINTAGLTHAVKTRLRAPQ